MTAEPSKTTGGVGESGPNPTSLPAENGEKNQKDEGDRQIVSRKRAGGERGDVDTDLYSVIRFFCNGERLHCLLVLNTTGYPCCHSH